MTKTNKRKWTWLLWAVPAVAVLGVVGAHGAMMLVPPPADLDYSTTRASDLGAFTATIEPGAEPIAIGEVQTWTIDVAMADGKPVDLAAITVDGGMPLHGHGLPSEPQVTRDLGDGRFEVEGLKFSMGGWWVVNVHVDTPDGEDKATFNLAL